MRELREDVATEARSAEGPLREAFEIHYERLVRLCFLLTGRRDAAEDVVQEAFVRLAGKIDRLDAEAVGPYVRRIALNLWKNRLRRLALELRHRSSEPPRAERPISIEAVIEDGNMLARFPTEAAFHLHAIAKQGHVSSDFSPMETRKRGDVSEINEVIGDAPATKLSFRADEGNIHISEVIW